MAVEDRIQPGPREVIEDLYRTRHSAIEGWLTTITRDREAAADAVQEAFVRLLQQTQAGRAPLSPEAWVRRVALNVFISDVRHARVAERHAATWTPADDARSAENGALIREDGRQVAHALRGLGDRDRATVVLAAAGYGTAEITARLGGSDGATRTRLCRARARLRTGLAAAAA